jgi:hypothetical protein
MSKKHRDKLKRKHGQKLVELDFLSPLKMEDCISHLKSGRSPIRALQLRVATNHNDVLVVWIRKFRQWEESVWFEGRLEPVEGGLTRVHGFIMSDYGSTLRTAIADTLATVGSAAIIVSVALLILGTRSHNGIFALAWGVLMGGVVLYSTMRKQHLDRLSSHLSDFINERLNVQRTTLHEHTTD